MNKRISELEKGTELSLFEDETEFIWGDKKFKVEEGLLKFQDEMHFVSMQVVNSETLIGVASSFNTFKVESPSSRSQLC